MKNQTLTNRYDATIEYDVFCVGVIALENIHEGKVEYYVTLSKSEYKRYGIAKTASDILLRYAFYGLELDEFYLCNKVDNVAAQNLFKKGGFHNKDKEYSSAINTNKTLDCYHNTIIEEEFMTNNNRIHVCGGRFRKIFSPFADSNMRWAI